VLLLLTAPAAACGSDPDYASGLPPNPPGLLASSVAGAPGGAAAPTAGTPAPVASAPPAAGPGGTGTGTGAGGAGQGGGAAVPPVPAGSAAMQIRRSGGTAGTDDRLLVGADRTTVLLRKGIASPPCQASAAQVGALRSANWAAIAAVPAGSSSGTLSYEVQLGTGYWKFLDTALFEPANSAVAQTIYKLFDGRPAAAGQPC
jgi:hypothetical protein